MKKRLQISTFLITVIFLAFFASLYSIDCLCCIPDFIPSSHQDVNHNKNCCYADAFKQDRNPDYSYVDICCKDNSPTFFTEIPEVVHKTYQLKLKNQKILSSLQFIEDTLKLDFYKNQTISYQLKLLLPKIIDIRIFIQSFII